MSKKKNQAEEKIEGEESPLEVVVHAEAEDRHEIPPPSPTVGRIVHFTKAVPQSNGSTILEPQAAIISGINPPGNFQRGDWAISLWLFPGKVGAGLEQKHGVLYSKEPREGRWSYIDR